jgi:hypothetical protein
VCIACVLCRDRAALRPADDRGRHRSQTVDAQELAALILSGEFVLQLHIGALLLAGVHDHLDLVTCRMIR